MVIQHNLSAMNANRMFGITQNQLANSTEKLSSGYTINRAADNAAGLSISEKMRKKIRGLSRGKENIQEGISLCQVADGALGEVTELIQRMSELSIQAYNDTNSKTDRQCIQDEVNQCLTEIDRIFETTKFNDTYIFRNARTIKRDVFHSEPISFKVKKWSDVTNRDAPQWLTVNDVSANFANNASHNMTTHPGYPITQVTDKIMKHNFRLADNSYVRLYYGQNQGTTSDGYQWVGSYINDPTAHGYAELMTSGTDLYNHVFATDNNGNYKHVTVNAPGNYTYIGWTATGDDNVSTKINFQGLQTTDADELYQKMFDLLGVEIALPCGTCNRWNGIRFNGELEQMDNITFFSEGNYLSTDVIGLTYNRFTWDGTTYTGYFEAIKAIQELDDADPTKTVKTASLSDTIAKELTRKTYDCFSRSMESHFDRAIMDSSDDYSVYVYDYRDVDATNTSSHIKVTSSLKYQYEDVITLNDGYYTQDKRVTGDKIWIQCSDTAQDGLYINLSNLSLKSMNLAGYDVSRYYTEYKSDSSFLARLAEWESQAPQPYYEEYSGTMRVLKKFVPAVIQPVYVNGERVGDEIVSPAIREYEDIWSDHLLRAVYPPDTRGERPKANYIIANEVYDPSDVSLLDEALKTISKTRSYFGASQNRLEHAYASNYNTEENLTASESLIRDADMAEEIQKHSLQSILQQAGLSMITQANQNRQGVLALLT